MFTALRLLVLCVGGWLGWVFYQTVEPLCTGAHTVTGNLMTTYLVSNGWVSPDTVLWLSPFIAMVGLALILSLAWSISNGLGGIAGTAASAVTCAVSVALIHIIITGRVTEISDVATNMTSASGIPANILAFAIQGVVLLLLGAGILAGVRGHKSN